jgi:hypothetical protein
MKTQKKGSQISEKQRKEDETLREVLRNADLKKFAEALRKVVNIRTK